MALTEAQKQKKRDVYLSRKDEINAECRARKLLPPMSSEEKEAIRLAKWQAKVPKGRALNDGSTCFAKGHTPHNLGVPMSDATKQKMVESKSKNPCRPWLGKKRDEATIEKMRKANTGRPSPTKGIAQPKLSGPCHYNWKGGVTSENKKARHSVEYRQWREAVFTRDNWACQKCGCRGGYMHPHHIENFSEHREKRFMIDNGATLCTSCHKAFHKEFGRSSNTAVQLSYFIGKGAS